MSVQLSVSIQAIIQDLSRATGEYESLESGTMSPEQLLQLLIKVKDLTPPDYDSGEDLCPPGVFTNGPAGEFCFIVGGGRILGHAGHRQGQLADRVVLRGEVSDRQFVGTVEATLAQRLK